MPNTYIIAEAGVNHNGSMDRAKQLIDTAADSGADAIKFQTFKADSIVSKSAPKARYQKQLTNNQESQYEMLKTLELNYQNHLELVQYCEKKAITFLSTPFDEESLDLLVNEIGMKKIKIASGEITNAPFLLQIAQTNKPVILSTGMSSIGEVEQALSVLAFGYMHQDSQPSLTAFESAFSSNEGQAHLKEKVSLLHCTTEYPTPINEVNLRAMDTLKQTFGLKVGYSDHTEGISVPIGAVARGASVIEKHFTLDRQLPGPDHKASLEPNELNKMIRSIREIECALGSFIKAPTQSEVNNKNVVRKGIIAKKNIKKGENFTKENLSVKRPRNGLSPFMYWDLLKEKADKDYSKGEVVK